jgi:glycosyltransferase involved in cell wall biosynthesis
MSKIKVLYVIDRIMVGGAEQVFIDILSLMQDRVEPYVLLISRSEPQQLKRLQGLAKVFELNRNSRLSITSLMRTYRIIKSVDLLHVHLRPTLRYINLVRLFSKAPKPLLFHDHYGITRLGLMDELLMFRLVKVDYYLAVNMNVMNWAKQKWQFKGIDFLTNIPSVSGLKNNVIDVATNEKNLKNYDTHFVYVSNIKHTKNQKFALELSQKIGKNILFIGNNQDNAYFNELTLRCSHCIIENEENPVRYFDNCKFGIFTSPMETGPLVVLEYFVSGLPFIAFKTGGISDILFKYVPEYFMDDFVLENWIDRYKLLLKDYQRIPQELIDRVINTEFNSKLYAEKLMEIYKKCRKADS